MAEGRGGSAAEAALREVQVRHPARSTRVRGGPARHIHITIRVRPYSCPSHSVTIGTSLCSYPSQLVFSSESTRVFFESARIFVRVSPCLV